MGKKIGYLGPAGTFTEQAAIFYDPYAELIPFPSISSIAESVDTGSTDEGVVPIENSLQGSVTETLDLLIHDTNLSIYQEIIIPIEHCLIVKTDFTTSRLEIVYSHPMALGQCKKYLEDNYSNAVATASLSTSAAVEDMLASEKPAAAIGTERAAKIYDVVVLDTGIQDNKSNHTRFVVLAKSDHKVTGTDKTSLCFSFGDDKAGMLHSVLGCFAESNINLAKVESRPNKEGLGGYFFLLDVEGHRENKKVKEAIQKVSKQVSMIKIFGSYPIFH